MVKSILKLQNIGTEEKVLIIAGGHSVRDFRFDKLPTDIYIFGVNFQFLNKTKYGKDIKLDYQIYTDKSFSDLSEYMDFGDTKLIGFMPTRPNDANLLSEKANYWFNETVLNMEKDSCYYAIKICHDIMKFDEIYVIGLDRYFENDIIHYWGDEFTLNGKEYKIHANEKKMIKEVQFKKMVKYYTELQYTNVYNSNPLSHITYFKHKFPWSDND